ncbi:MAG TPA: M28 family peptidase [Thermoanaerobaculia bacterium]|nr:M28 family peptidase [Thermoanaerobaculia bacterium]
MKRLMLVGFSLIFALAVWPNDQRPTSDDRLRTDVGFLAADAQEGRGLGTQGLARAADYLEKRMRAIGLQPAFGKSFRQKFPVKTGVSLGPNNSLSGLGKDDWTPLGFSSSGAFSGEIVFVGYGIEAPPLNYRELEGVDLKGKVALMLRYEPQEKDEKSVFDGRKPSRWSAMRYKVLQARERGAAAVIFANGPMQADEKDRVPVLKNDGPESPAGIPVLQVKTAVAQKWAGDLLEFQKAVDADLKPRSRATGIRIDGNVDVNATFADAENLAGIIPGRGPHADEIVVIGAHYDHLGYGGAGSMKPNVHAIHNGADDNASGTASVLSIAERLQNEVRKAKDRRTVLVMLFAAEETGLGGSSYFVGHSPLPIARMKAMVNLDMVGMMREDKLIVFGTESAAEWAAALAPIITETKLNVTEKGDGYGPSDQTAFYASRVPVLHLFTGAHERYHTPDDKADTLNYAGMERVVVFATDVMRDLTLAKTTPQYARVSAAPALEGDSRGYGAYLGTVPDYAAMEATTGGVKLADVRPGGPADKAGIRGGDVIIQMAGTKIENLYDMTYALQDHKPGETVDVVVMRNGERVTLRATLGSRSATPPAQEPPKSSSITAGKPFDKTFEGEKHLKDIRQLTFGGENAEAYFSPDGSKLIYQAHEMDGTCDQQYILDLKTGENKLVSSGKGRTTCGYFSYPKGDRIIYSSTEAGSPECPPPPDRSHGYVWGVFPTYDIYVADPNGANAKRIVSTPGYDAEATWCHQGGKIIMTSMRDGDLDLYEMDESGNVTKRLTNTPGYDGGAFYSADCKEIVWRAYHPTGAALDEYRTLLAKNLVKPSVMELFVANADGSNARQITSNGAANFCPYFMPDGKHIIFASNLGDPQGREFDLFVIPKSGGEPERITFAPGFDGFPVFSPDGQWLVWGSNRSNPTGYITNLFIAKWVE